MTTKKSRQIWFMSAASIVLAALVILMLFCVTRMQGNARVVNYTGILRSATQRLVKNELYGKPDDAEIARLDNIMDGLLNGGGSYHLSVLRDPTYQLRLKSLSAEWNTLKESLYRFRNDGTERSNFYLLSENFFILADDTVSAAEEYSDGMVQKLHILEVLTIADLLLLILTMVYQIVSELRQYYRLKTMAYLDPNTGLPNKRSCEEHLMQGGILGDSRHVCCLMFDLNNLKKVNDTLGHEAGDTLISSFASVLRRSAPPKMFVGRFGDDEFIGILDPAQKDEIEAFLRTLKSNVVHLNTTNTSNGIRLSYACGYAFSDDHNSCSIQSLMDLADRNMYLNKTEVKSAEGTGDTGTEYASL